MTSNAKVAPIKPYNIPSLRPDQIPASTMSKPQFFAYPKQGEAVRDLFWYSQSVRVGDRIEVSGQGKFLQQSHFRS